MSAVIEIPEDEQKYEEVKKTIEKLKNYNIQGKDVVINNDPYYVISLQGLGPDERIPVEHELYGLRKNHKIKLGIFDYAADVLIELVKKGKLFIP